MKDVKNKFSEEDYNRAVNAFKESKMTIFSHIIITQFLNNNNISLPREAFDAAVVSADSLFNALTNIDQTNAPDELCNKAINGFYSFLDRFFHSVQPHLRP